MSAKRVYPAALVLALLAGTAGRGQEPTPPSLIQGLTPPPSAGPAADPSSAPAGTSVPPGTVVSPWVAYPQCGCCGPVGRNGMVGTEVYMRSGTALVTGGDILHQSLQTGWEVGGGGRTLFFNPRGDAAWVVDLGVFYTHFNGKSTAPTFDLMNGTPDANGQPTSGSQVNIRNYHKIDATVFGGREWYLHGSVFDREQGKLNWRAGVDVGGAWGTSHVDLNVLDQAPDGYARKQDVTGSFLIALHTDVEVPFGGWLWFAGLRTEWDYTWTDILSKDGEGQGRDLQTVNLLISTGIRY
jgi:hypothetical protein